jgi:hypothetical protein
MARGGQRAGAGRPERGEVARAVFVRFTAAEAATLAALEVELRVSASEVLRMAVAELARARKRKA